ncbi:MAG: CPBP family intramembrane glutamate endopeptidase, partial [Lactobacillaceae bacterium]
MNKLKQLVIGIILFIPFLFLASGVSLVDCFFEGVLLNWLFIVIAASISIPSLLFIDRHIKPSSTQQLNQPLKARYFYIAVIWTIFIVVLTITLNNLPFLPAPTDNV